MIIQKGFLLIQLKQKKVATNLKKKVTRIIFKKIQNKIHEK